MSGLFRELYLRNLWVVDVVLGNKICTGMPREETHEVIRTVTYILSIFWHLTPS